MSQARATMKNPPPFLHTWSPQQLLHRRMLLLLPHNLLQKDLPHVVRDCLLRNYHGLHVVQFMMVSDLVVAVPRKSNSIDVFEKCMSSKGSKVLRYANMLLCVLKFKNTQKQVTTQNSVPNKFLNSTCQAKGNEALRDMQTFFNMFKNSKMFQWCVTLSPCWPWRGMLTPWCTQASNNAHGKRTY